MTKKEKVVFVINELKKLYPKIPIPLEHTDPYTLLIAVLMSAQSTDVRVNKITPLLCDRSERKYIKHERCEKVIQAAIKQSLRAYMPILNPLTPLKELDLKGPTFFAHLLGKHMLCLSPFMVLSHKEQEKVLLTPLP